MAWVSDPFTGAGAWRCRPSPRPFSALVFGWMTQRPFGTSPQAGRTNREAAFQLVGCLRPRGGAGQGRRRSTPTLHPPSAETSAEGPHAARWIASKDRHHPGPADPQLQAAAGSLAGAAELAPGSGLRIPEPAPRASIRVASSTSKLGMKCVGTVLRPTSTAT
jgi:hypothetical protein